MLSVDLLDVQVMYAQSILSNLDKISNFILASASPRRAELLRSLIPEFEVIPADIDETLKAGETAIAATVRLATTKARASHRAGTTTLGVDTLCQLGTTVIGKPTSQSEARELLHRLSGETHTVVSSFCVKADTTEKTISATAEVTFRVLPLYEIEEYLASTDATQYAGGYAIQGAGRQFVERINGELETVIGLPVKELKSLLI